MYPQDSNERTLLEFGIERLKKLAVPTGMKPRLPELIDLFGRLTSTFGRQPIGRPPRWRSSIGDDHSPFEFSLALSGAPELRIMVEPLGDPPSLRSNRDAALALLESLARDYEVDLRRLRQVEDLFLPNDAQGAFAIWVAVACSPTQAPEFKLYLNPGAHGPAAAAKVIEEALVRLGFASAWPVIAGSIARRGPYLDELKYVSLDLARTADARVKIYARHHRATLADLEAAAGASPAYHAGDVTRFLQRVAPDVGPVFRGRGVFTCLSFVENQGSRPAAVTTHFPINGYAASDAAVRERVIGVLADLGLSTEVYAATVAAHAERPLADSIGLQSYVSFRREHDQPRVTVYLAAEAYKAGVVAAANPPLPPSSIDDIVERYEHEESITNHPYLQRLRREPVNLHHLWKLLANFQLSISKYFARHLAGITARVDDDRIRSILAMQLNDELGGGHPERAHVQLFARMMDDLARWKPATLDEQLLTPARNLNPRLTRIYNAADVNESVGAIMAGEVFGKQMDQFIADEFRRQREVDPESLEWLMLHEKLEVEHAAASSELAALLPPDALATAWRGASDLADAGWKFLDDLYEVCYATALER